MKFNYAVYATRETIANGRIAEQIKLNASGQAVNTGNGGRTFTVSEVIAAQDAQGYRTYADAMTFLDSVIGDDNDTATRKAFDRATAKFQSVEHAQDMKAKLMIAALGGSNAALIAYAAASLYLNEYASVDFSWFVNGSEELTIIRDDQGYEAATITISTDAVIITDESDYEGFAVSYGFSADNAVTNAPTTREKAATETAAPVKIAPMVVSLQNEKGQMLMWAADGWKAQSKSNPANTHTTAHDGSTCDCQGFTGRYRKCWHTALVRETLA